MLQLIVEVADVRTCFIRSVEFPHLLLDASKVNVLCGPNSSGKSTVLSALAESADALIDTPKLLANGHASIAAHLATYISSEHRTDFGPILDDLLRNIHWPNPIGETEIAVKLRELGAAFLDSRFNFHASLDIAKLQSALLAKIPKLRVKLVRPKRLLETNCNFPYHSDAQLEGHRVLEQLFRIQNKRTDHRALSQLALLEETFKEITEGTSFAVELSDGATVHLLFKVGSSDLLPADRFGLGLQDVLVLLYNCLFEDHNLLLIEELENHLHPSLQRRLLTFIKGLPDRSVIVTTHSSTVLASPDIGIYVTKFVEGRGVKVVEASARAEALSATGYLRSDFLSAKCLAFLEGPGDIEVVRGFLEREFAVGEGEVAFVHVSGDSCSRFPIGQFTEVYDNCIAFLDSELEEGSRRHRRTFKRACAKETVECFLSKRPTLEHYFPPSSYKKVLPDMDFPPEWDDKTQVWKQCKAAQNTIKNRLPAIADVTSWDVLKDTDFGVFVSKLANLARGEDIATPKD